MTTLASSDPIPAGRVRAPGLYRFSVLFTVLIVLHIKGGALVTSTGSGMAFTDWPLADGSLWPRDMGLAGLLEHLHRISGTVVGLLSIALLVWVVRSDRRRWLKRVVWTLLGMVVAQGVLGGLGVLYGEAGGKTFAPAAIGHAILAQPTLCVAVFVAFCLSPAWDEHIEVGADAARTARKLATTALGLVFVQLAIGAVVRHTNAVSMLWLHVFMALVVSLAILIASAYTSDKVAARSPAFRSLGRWTMALLLTQLTLGFLTLGVRRVKDPSNIEYLGRSVVASGHVVVGACLFLLATLLVARTWRNLTPGAAR